MVARVCLAHDVALDVDHAGILHCPADPTEAVTRWGVVSAAGELLAVAGFEWVCLGPALAGVAGLVSRGTPTPLYFVSLRRRRPLPQAA